MKRVLIVSIAAPPKSDPESLQVRKYIKELSRHFVLDLITTESSSYGWNKHHSKTEGAAKYLNSIILLNGYNNRFFSFAKRFIPSQLLMPDQDFHFHLSIKKSIAKMASAADLIYSRSLPVSSAILAYKIAQKLNKPWIMHLSDPMAMSTSPKRLQLWEETCFQRANSISVTNEAYLSYLQERYPQMKDKFFISYNVYDKTYPRITSSKKFIMAYFGNFYAGRSPMPVLKKVSMLYNEDKTLFRNFEIHFYGNWSESIGEEIASLNLPFLIAHDAIPSNEIPDKLKDVTLLLNFEDAEQFDGNILTLPSKVMDYLSYQRPMLSITPNQSPSNKLLSKGYGSFFTASDESGITNFIKSQLHSFHQGDFEFLNLPDPPKQLSASYQASKLAQRINEILSKD